MSNVGSHHELQSSVDCPCSASPPCKFLPLEVKFSFVKRCQSHVIKKEASIVALASTSRFLAQNKVDESVSLLQKLIFLSSDREPISQRPLMLKFMS